ncbi:MAG: chemotaxis protein CheB [Alphaproteobacteria bacterium]|nr:chemotaxis protein CheB [Alphaproteobacteria bacterium]
MLSASSQSSSALSLRAQGYNTHIEAVVIGASLGGPQAVSTVLQHLTPHIDHVAIFIVMHMPSNLATTLTTQLASISNRNTHLCIHGEAVQPGHIYLAPGHMHMRIVRAGTKIVTLHDDRPPQHFCKPSVDVTFQSFAQVYGAHGLALVLTGMGQDGLAGSKSIVDSGGRVFVQDEKSSAVWGMPGSIAKAGLASAILPPEELAKAVALHLINSSPGVRS